MNLPLLPSHPACTLCELHTTARSIGVPSVWFPRSLPPGEGVDAVVFVGQNPGHFEDIANEPFVGPSGRLVKDAYILAPSLHTVCSIYLSNACRCTTPADAAPKDRSYRACSGYLIEDLDAISSAHLGARHKCVVCLGAPATAYVHRLLFGKKLTLSEGFRSQGRSGHIWTVYSTFHPAAVLRERKLLHAVHDHLTLLFDHLENLSAPRSSPLRIPPRPPRRTPTPADLP